MNDRLTLSLGTQLRPRRSNPYRNSTTRSSPAWTTIRWTTTNLSPRLGFAYNVGRHGNTVVRGGYGLFYDNTHLELVSGLIHDRRVLDSFVATFPANAPIRGPRRPPPTDPTWSTGRPSIARALTAVSAGSKSKNTGTVVLDNPARRIPYTHQITVGVERQLASNLSGSVDYVRTMARDQFMIEDLNPGLRDTTAVTNPLGASTPTSPPAVNMPSTRGASTTTRCCCRSKSASATTTHPRPYTLSYSRGNTSAPARPRADSRSSTISISTSTRGRRTSIGVTLRRERHGAGAEDGRPDVSWVARALSGLPFTILNNQIDPDRNGTLAEPLPAGCTAARASTPSPSTTRKSAMARMARISSSSTCASATRFGCRTTCDSTSSGRSST